MIKQMTRLRASYDSQVRPIIKRLDEIWELRKRYVELPENIQAERRRLLDRWNELGTKLYRDFLEMGGEEK